MRTWLRFWKRTEALDVDLELRAARPVPREQFVKSLAAWMSPKPVSPVRTRSRIAIAGVATAVMVAAVGATGGFSAAASSVLTAARATGHAVQDIVVPPQVPATPHTAPSPPSSAAAQYLGVPTITHLSVTLGKAGTSVTVTGTNLGGITAMTVAGLSIDVSTISNPTTGLVTFNVPATATAAQGPVTVTNPAGTAPSSQTFTVEVQPAITTLETYNLEAGETIYFNGSGFLGVDLTGGSVKFGGKAATYTVVNDGRINATVPSGVTAGNLQVANFAGKSNTVAYTVASGPHVTSFTPMTGGLGTLVKIKGTGFVNGADQVTIGDSAQIPAIFVSATEIDVNVPADATVGFITVNDSSGGSSTSVQKFTPIFAPHVASFAPTPGAGVGQSVTLTGTHFTGVSSVKFTGGATGKAAPFTVSSDTSITAIVPAGATSGPITVTNAAGHDNSNTGTFTVLAAPTITNVTAPNPAVAGNTVTIAGTNFVDTPTVHVRVSFTGGASNQAVVGSTTSITVTIPVGAKTGPVKVTEAGGTAVSGSHTVTIAGAPTVSSLVPAAQVADNNPLHAVTINGKGFNGSNSATPTVTFTGGSTGVVHAGNTDTKLVVTVPSGALIGPITVTTNAGSGTSNTFTPIKIPVLSSIWPSQGQKLLGQLTITGTHMSGAKQVTFTRNGVKTPFTAVPAVISDSNIVVTVPAGAATGPITVTNSANEVSNTIAFTVLQAPTFTSFDGTSGSHAGENLVINGSNFINTDDQVVTVKIGTANCPVTSVGGGTQITCTIPAGLAGKTLGVTITTEAGMTTSGTHKYAFH